MTYPKIRRLIAEGRFDEARAQIAQIGLTVDTDPRVPVQLKQSDHAIGQITFICGVHRSGTTLFHDYLARHYDIAFMERTKVPENEGQFLQDVYPLERPFGGPGTFAFYPQMRPGPVSDPREAARSADRILGHWAAYCNDPQHRHLLEKSPPNVTRIAYLRSLFPTARFVLWTRDPRAVTLSTRKWHNLPVDTLMHHWNCAYMTALDALRDDDCMVLSYEAFCSDPAGMTARVADFAGLSPRSAPLVGKARFATIQNSNQPYLDAFPAKLNFRASVRAWELLGYAL